MKKISFFFCFINFLISYGQSNLDSLFDADRYEELVNILTKKGEKEELLASELFYLGKSYGRLGNYSNGLLISDKMIQKSLSTDDSLNLMKAINLKAENLIDLNKIKEGIEFCEKVSNVFRPQDSIQLELLCFKWGMLYFQNDEYDKALDIYNRIKSDKFVKLNLYRHNYALILMRTGNYENALKGFNESLKENKKDKDSAGVTLVYSNMANLFLNKREFETAKIYLDSSARFETKETPLRLIKNRLDNYYEYYKHTNSFDEASVYLDSVKMVEELMFNKKLNENIKEAETADVREKSLQNKVKLTDSKLERTYQQILWGIIIVVIVILGLLFLTFLYKYRNIKSAHENILIEQKLLRSQMTPHFIFNSLAVLQGMILNDEKAKGVAYLSKFSKLLRGNLENSRNNLVMLDKELNTIEHYIDIQNLAADHIFDYSIKVDDNVQADEFLVPTMMIQPFVENAIEHGFQKHDDDKKIEINISFKENKLLCVIKDNGVGVDHNKIKNDKKKSLATIITKERLAMLSKEFKTESYIEIEDMSIYGERGTKVSLVLPHQLLKY
ncbi:tetratricopeptide repeat-containing sensor histidine kinase [Aquimarina algiphila]|uniref:tetratricopeptide repeat-containing sensor histidine kinase n=1 Tax=Aquimarina algiphila TaxID=2047982 RepID=UPI002492CE0E|nr:histidine kinase [Aquimarina algiphila]